MKGTVLITGASSLAGTASFGGGYAAMGGTVTDGGVMSVASNVLKDGTASVTGASTFEGTVSITGASTLEGIVSTTCASSLAGTASFGGNYADTGVTTTDAAVMSVASNVTGMLFGDGAAFLPLYSSLPLNVTNKKTNWKFGFMEARAMQTITLAKAFLQQRINLVVNSPSPVSNSSTCL